MAWLKVGLSCDNVLCFLAQKYIVKTPGVKFSFTPPPPTSIVVETEISDFIRPPPRRAGGGGGVTENLSPVLTELLYALSELLQSTSESCPVTLFCQW